MLVGIVESNYSSIRLFEILLKHEGHEIRSFGRFEQLEKSQEIFDILLIDPGFPEQAPYILQQLSKIQPGAKRIICTIYEEVLLISRIYPELTCLMMPFKRAMLLSLINETNPYEAAAHDMGED